MAAALDIESGIRAAGKATRARILNSACSLMWHQGVNGTTLDDVRNDSHTSKSQLYKHFQNKDSLVLAVVKTHGQAVIDRERKALDSVDSFAALQRWVDSIVATKALEHGAYGCVLGTFANELADQNEAARVELAATIEEWRGFITAALRRMAEKGELGETVDVDRVSTAIIGALQGGYVLARVSRDVGQLEISASFALEHVRSLMKFR